MRLLRDTIILFVVVAISARASTEDFLDRLDNALTASTADGLIAGRLSGTLDLEGYSIPDPPPGLIYAPGSSLFNPRLSLFLDAQFGLRCYVFAQTRVDRGFDPSNGGLRVRLDEYALRVAVLDNGRLNLQAGRFATVVGRWIQRHGSWENPFITAPLFYENLTGIWDSAAAKSTDTLLSWAHIKAPPPGVDEYADKHLRVPVIWGPSYASGVAASGELGKFDYAIETKNASLSSRPDTWTSGEGSWHHPTFSGRIGYRPNVMWNFGVSASTGHYLRTLAAPTLAPGYGLGDYRQIVFGQDAGFAWRHWQAWTELVQARFEIPRVGNVDTWAGFAEVKYKLTPQLAAAVRVNRQTFSEVTDGKGRRLPWGHDVWRFDFAPSYRFTSHVQLKVQYSFQQEADSEERNRHLVAAQSTVRF